MQRHLFCWLVPLPFDLPPILLGFNKSAALVVSLRFLVRSSNFLCLCSSCESSRYLGLHWWMSSTRGAVTSVQAFNWLLAFMVGIVIPRPLCRACKVSTSLSRSVIPCLPVTAGRNWCRIASSSGCRRRSVPGTVRMRNVHLFVRAWVKTA